jgi:hypothetical protein
MRTPSDASRAPAVRLNHVVLLLEQAETLCIKAQDGDLGDLIHRARRLALDLRAPHLPYPGTTTEPEQAGADTPEAV